MKPQYPPNKVLLLNGKGDPFGSMEGAGLVPSSSKGAASGGLQGTAMPLSMTISGDRLVVAEPAVGPKGEAGYRIAIYNMAAIPIKIVGSIFHASPHSPQRLPAKPGFGGFGGGLGSGGNGFGGSGGSGGGGFGGSGSSNEKPVNNPKEERP